jgi:hypothetical protein
MLFCNSGRYQECLDQIATGRRARAKPKPAGDSTERLVLPGAGVSGPLLDQIEEHVRELLRVEPKVQELLAGRRKPADFGDDDDLPLLAESTTNHGAFVVAARLWRAVRQDIILSWLIPSGEWESATRAAAAAGCKRSVPDEERAKFRKFALALVREQLAAHRKELKSKRPLDRLLVTRHLGSLLASADLVGVREEAELAKLPADEQAEWRAVWAQVKGLLAEVTGPARTPDLIPRLEK